MKHPPIDIHTEPGPDVETMTESKAPATRKGTINAAGATAIGVAIWPSTQRRAASMGC